MNAVSAHADSDITWCYRWSPRSWI